MRCTLARSVLQRVLLCALAMLLAVAPVTGAAAATADVPEQAKAPDASPTEAVAATGDATVDAAPTAAATATESAEVTATQQDTTQVDAPAAGGGGGANQDGPYTPAPTASPTPSGNGQGKNPHDSGSKGNADNKNPPGQMPGPDEDGDQGYECDGNQGVAKGNPAHTACPPPNPQISIDKTGPETSSVGSTITYTMRVTNPGNRPMSDVVVSDPDCDSAPVRTGGDTNGDNVLQTTETWTYTCPRVVQQGDPSPLPNVATVRGTSPEGVTKTDHDDHSVTLSTVQPSPPIINIDKTGPATSTVGSTITYTMVVTNPSATVPLKNVVVTDTRCKATPVRTGGDANGDNVLQSSETWTYTCQRTIAAADLDANDILHNTARVDARSTDTNESVFDTDPHQVTVSRPASPLIDIDKTGPGTSTVGSTITYTMVVSNPRTPALQNVVVTDPRCNAGSLTGPSFTAGDSDNRLDQGERWTYTCQRTIAAADLDANNILHNTARVDARSADSNEAVFDTDPHQVTVAPQLRYDVSITKDPDFQSVVFGGTATWTITVRNTGTSALTGVVVSDPEAPECNRTIGNLPVGAEGVRSWPCSRLNVTTGFTNIAYVDSNETDMRQDSAVVSVVPQQTAPSIVLNKRATPPECPRPGQVLRYHFEIINNGNQTLSNVALSDPLVGGAIPLPSTTMPARDVINVTASYTLTQADIDDGQLVNSASVTSTATSGAPVNNTASALTMLEPCPEVALDKHGPDIAQVGEQITYTFKVTNTGNVTLTNVRIYDQRLRISGQLVNPSTLAPGEFGTTTATYTVTRRDGRRGEILNTAFTRARTPDGSEIDATDDHRTTVPRVPEAPEAGIRVNKSGPRRAGVGESVTYRFTVTNTGDVTLTDVSISDPLLGLDQLTVRPSTLEPGQRGTATATYVISEDDADAGSVYNTAVARGNPPQGPPVTDDDDHTVRVPSVPPGPPVCPSPPCGPPPPPPPPELPETGIGTTGFALTALLSLALGGVLLGIAGAGNVQAAMANATVNADSPMLAMLRRWNLAPKPGGAQARRRRRR